LSNDSLKNDSLLGNSELASSLALRSSRLLLRHPPRFVAAASIVLAAARRPSGSGKGEGPVSEDAASVLSPALRQRLCMAAPEDEVRIGECLADLRSILLKEATADAEKSAAGVSSPAKFGTPPSAGFGGSRYRFHESTEKFCDKLLSQSCRGKVSLQLNRY
jgi:hypothetical protein